MHTNKIKLIKIRHESRLTYCYDSASQAVQELKKSSPQCTSAELQRSRRRENDWFRAARFSMRDRETDAGQKLLHHLKKKNANKCF